MALLIGHCYQFGDFTVDCDQKVLLRNGSPLPLAPKVFDTLLILVDNNGRLVEKDEFIKQLWPNSFVEESNLTFNIQQVRKILGDNAREPRFIETVARRGYRFIAEVTKTQSAVAVTVESEKLSSAEFRPALKKTYLPVVFASSILVVASVVFVSWFVKSRRTVAGSHASLLDIPFKSEKFASSGFVRAVITPDGKFVAYTVETQSKQSIWLRQLETSENIQIVPPTDDQYLGMTTSHDGNSLYFVRRARSDPPISELYRVMTFGGIPVKITQHTEGTVSLSPDDKEISFIRCRYQNEDFCSLMLIDLDGRNERKLLTRRHPIRLSAVQFSPDGRSIAFASGESSNGGSNFRLMLLDLSTGVERQVSPKTFFVVTSLKWLPNGNELLLAARENHDGRLRIWYVSTLTGEARPLTKDAIDYITLSLDQAADKLLATYTSNNFHLFTGRIDDLSKAKSLAVARVGVAVGPDGKIVYEGNDGDLWMIDSDGGERRQLTNSPFSDVFPRLSQDGRYIFFTSTRSGTAQVWRMNADGSDQVQITSREGGHPKYVTADGRLVYFGSGLHQTLWRVSTNGGDETEVSKVKISFPAFSNDGKLVAYFFRDETNRIKIGVMSLDTGAVITTLNLTNNSFQQGRIAWLPDNKSFYYVTVNGSQSLLWLQSLYGANAPQQVANLGDDEIADLALSPLDGSLAFIRGKWIHEAVLIEGLK